MRNVSLLFLLIFALPAWAGENILRTSGANEALFNDLSSKMACLCGCGATIKSCPHEKCSFSVPVRKEMHRMIETGFSREEIKAALVSNHGEAILALPEFKGFNIMAWVTPFALILLVGYGIATLVRRWSAGDRAEKAKTSGESKTEENDPFLKRMRSELERFED